MFPALAKIPTKVILESIKDYLRNLADRDQTGIHFRQPEQGIWNSLHMRDIPENPITTFRMTYDGVKCYVLRGNTSEDLELKADFVRVAFDRLSI